MSPSSRSVHYLARRACAHDLCRIFRSATCGQRCHWPMHIKSFQKTRATLHLTAFANSAKAHLQLAEMQPGRDTRAFLERIRCAAATRKAVGGRRFQRSCTDRHHTLAIPWDASRAPFLLLASILQISPECFFLRSLQEGFLSKKVSSKFSKLLRLSSTKFYTFEFRRLVAFSAGPPWAHQFRGYPATEHLGVGVPSYCTLLKHSLEAEALTGGNSTQEYN